MCAKRTSGPPCFIGVFVPACASLARYSGAAERFALSSPLHPFGASTTTACFAHSARPSCASSIQHGRPAALTSSLAALPASLGLLRPVSRTARGLRALPQFSMVVPLRSQARLRHSLLHWAYYGLFRALRAAFVRFHQFPLTSC